MATGLTYSIQRQILFGRIGTEDVRLRAASGGRRGRAGEKPSLMDLQFWNPSVKLPELLGSVGAGGGNAVQDARTVQALLRKAGIRVAVDGRVGPMTVAAIAAFQNDIGITTPDGRVDRKGATWKALLRPVAGGPLPPGTYGLVHQPAHPVFHECIFLEPIKIDEFLEGVTAWQKRSGFFIHGRGDRGSDGCIVPDVPAERASLNALVKAAAAQIRLSVIEPYLPAPLVQRIELLGRLA